MRKSNPGFTLVEIMIVVGVVLILAVIAVPNMIRSKIIANETSAIAVLKASTSACGLYAMDNNTYPGTINTLTLVTPPYVNPDVAEAFAIPATPKDGYRFTYAQTGGGSGFTITGIPIRARVSGVRYFCCNESGVIRYVIYPTTQCNPATSQPVS